VGNLAKIVGCITFAFASSWQSAIVYLPFFIILLIVSPLIFKKIQLYANKEKVVYESAKKCVQESLDSIRTVASFGLEKVFMSKYNKILDIAKKISIENGLISGTVEEISVDICTLLHAFSIAYLTSLAEKRCEHQSYVDLTRSFFSILFACLNIISLILFLKQIFDTEKSVRKVFEILDEKMNNDDNQDSDNNVKLECDILGTLKFENVYFKYPALPNINILKGLSFDLKFGSTVAFVGARFVFLRLNFTPFQNKFILILVVEANRLSFRYLKDITCLVQVESHLTIEI
jgi:ATP-binding cassette subfamily B (MDR/TAP) protein 1